MFGFTLLETIRIKNSQTRSLLCTRICQQWQGTLPDLLSLTLRPRWRQYWPATYLLYRSGYGQRQTRHGPSRPEKCHPRLSSRLSRRTACPLRHRMEEAGEFCVRSLARESWRSWLKCAEILLTVCLPWTGAALNSEITTSMSHFCPSNMVSRSLCDV